MSWKVPTVRGHVLRVNIGLDEPKLVVVVSNNPCNRRLDSVLVVRVTTSPKPNIPSIVELDDSSSFAGRIVCDDIFEVYEDEVVGVAGAVGHATLARVDEGLRAALALA